MTDFARLLEMLVSGGVEFIIIGGVAATAHGSAHVTTDLDIVYRRTAENIVRLALALSPLKPYLRGAPAGEPTKHCCLIPKHAPFWASKFASWISKPFGSQRHAFEMLAARRFRAGTVPVRASAPEADRLARPMRP